MAQAKGSGGWKCSQCGTTDPLLHYASGKMKKCKDCQRFYNVSVNAARPRKLVRQPKLKMTEKEFLEWSRSTPRVCRYCGIGEDDIGKLDQKTQIGLTVAALGIDRLDSDGDYETGNIDFCCFACNKAKGNVFDDQEMKVVGKAVAEVWKQRLAKATGSP